MGKRGGSFPEYHVQKSIPAKGSIMKNKIIQIILSIFIISAHAHGTDNFEKEIEHNAAYFCKNNSCGFQIEGKQFDDKKIYKIIKNSSVRPDAVKALYFIETSFSGTEADIIREFHNLEKVLILGGPVSDDGLLNCFGTMKKLKSLVIPGTLCSEKSLIEILKNNPQLEELFITDCPVGESLLPFLLKLNKLKKLHMTGRKVALDTIENVQKLKMAFPDCKIFTQNPQFSKKFTRGDENENNGVSTEDTENPVFVNSVIQTYETNHHKFNKVNKWTSSIRYDDKNIVLNFIKNKSGNTYLILLRYKDGSCTFPELCVYSINNSKITILDVIEFHAFYCSFDYAVSTMENNIFILTYHRDYGASINPSGDSVYLAYDLYLINNDKIKNINTQKIQNWVYEPSPIFPDEFDEEYYNLDKDSVEVFEDHFSAVFSQNTIKSSVGRKKTRNTKTAAVQIYFSNKEIIKLSNFFK